VNPAQPFPRYVKTTHLSRRVLIGPLEDKHAAARLIALVEDAFDLCRYYNVLVESRTDERARTGEWQVPRARATAAFQSSSIARRSGEP